MPTLTVPPQLAALAGGRRTVAIEAGTLAEAFQQLDVIAPMLRSQLLESSGMVRQFVGLFVDNKQVISLNDGELSLAPGSQIAVVMAVAGG